MAYTDEHAQQRAEFIASLNLTYSARFIPQSVSRNAKEKSKTLNWQTSFTRGRATLETDFAQGVGHIPGYSLARVSYDKRRLEQAAESGRYPRVDGPDWHTKKLPEPDLESVLYCLVSDAVAWRMTFEEWCDELGYDTDSRKAHATYMACSEIGLKLVRLVGGHENFATLEELFHGF